MCIEAVSKDDLTQTTSIDGFARGASPAQLDISIIGAGLVGLATAAMLRKEGHRITIFESSSFHAELGAGIVLPPNGSGVLKRLLPELKWENMQTGWVKYPQVSQFPPIIFILSDGLMLVWQGYFMIHRVDLHKEMMRLALDPDAITLPPATIRLGASIRSVNFDHERPSVTTLTGEELKFDLILGTDGIKSTVRKCMIGTEYDAPPTQLAFYRWMIDLKKNPELSWIRDDRVLPGPTMMVGGDKVFAIIGYPIRGGNLLNCSAAHLDTRDQELFGGYIPCRIISVSELIDDFDDKFKALVNAAEKPTTWQLRKLPPLPTWVTGNVAILGDAAHAMFPTYGQGFAVGLEDASALATLFHRGTKASEIGERLKVFQEIRKPRAEYVSQMSTDAYKPPDEESPEGCMFISLVLENALSDPFLTHFLCVAFAGWLVPEFLDYDPVAITKKAMSEI
ncbi:hypothetical protein K438DRAFT_1630232 [Mycena galopus ATCC 62051]|nr:hypothetical protein K438DRAFT_1630232 [Mycena galopus ATCC 62051]